MLGSKLLCTHTLQVKIGDMEENDNDDHKDVVMETTELAFRIIDSDDDGYIDRAEFAKVSKNLSEKQIDKIWAKLDLDGDGKISIAEFYEMMNKKKKPEEK